MVTSIHRLYRCVQLFSLRKIKFTEFTFNGEVIVKVVYSPFSSFFKLIYRMPKFSYLATIWKVLSGGRCISSLRFSLTYWPKPPNSRPLSGARLELVDGNCDWRELREDGGHRLGDLTGQMMNWWMELLSRDQLLQLTCQIFFCIVYSMFSPDKLRHVAAGRDGMLSGKALGPYTTYTIGVQQPLGWQEQG
jgi:hypothetical protein